MDITREQFSRHSEQEFTAKFGMYVDSGAGVIHVRTNEVIRAAQAVRKAAIIEGNVYQEWDVVNGFRKFSEENIYDNSVVGDDNVDISSAFASPLGALRDGARVDTRYFCYINPHVFMESNPHMQQMLQHYLALLPPSKICVVLITPDIPLAGVSNNTLSLFFNPPGISELRECLEFIVDGVKNDFTKGISLTESDKDRICYVGSGMTKAHFEMYTALAIVEAGRNGKTQLTVEDLLEGVTVGKTDVVNSSDILELYPSGDIANVGGMENLKEWVRKRSQCYSDEARDFGIEPPKGIVLVGIPGTGKSLAAKAIGSVLGIPVVRLDFGRVFNSFVGASEQRMRNALKQVESMAPVILFADEIDKGLGGIANGASGDSGTSMRVLGSFLTWLQDCKHPVFTIVTANNIDGLPPELLRRGRFDAIFSVMLPNARERKEVLAIHLRLRGRNIAEFGESEVQKVIDASARYVSAEIESAVKDALVNAFSNGEELTMTHVQKALLDMVPLSKTYEDKINAMELWSKNNATPASLSEEWVAQRELEGKNRIRISKRSRK